MYALVYHGPGKKAWERVPDPNMPQPTDAVVQMETTTICGTDLHILKGDVPAVAEGRILGHEGVGTVVEVGRAVRTVRPGKRVIVSCIAPCGSCAYCQRQLQAHCLDREGASGVGWILGHLIDGTQAEYVRVPFADQTLHRIPEGVSDEAAIMLSDVLPTGFEIGVRNGRVQPGDVVAVVGAGPIGLAVVMTAGLYGAARIIAIDLDDNRLEIARAFGATDMVNSGSDDWRDSVMSLTGGGLGADVAVEAVGTPRTFGMCVSLIRPGGARRARHAGPPGPLDQGCQDHDRPGQRQHDADAPLPGRAGEARARAFHHPPLHHGPDRRRVRHLRSRGGNARGQGRDNEESGLRAPPPGSDLPTRQPARRSILHPRVWPPRTSHPLGPAGRARAQTANRSSRERDSMLAAPE